MPYSLVYGMEAVLPIEVEIPSLRILVESQLDEAEWANTRFEQLNLIEEQRLKAIVMVKLIKEEWLQHLLRRCDPETLKKET